MSPGVTDPPGFGGVSEQLLRHRQAEQLGIGKPGLAPEPPVPGHAKIRQETVRQKDMVGGQESGSVKFGVHIGGDAPIVCQAVASQFL